MIRPAFVDQVLAVARRHGWAVIRPGPGSDPGAPTLLLVRDGHFVAAHVGLAPPGFRGDEWMARLSWVPGCARYLWRPRDGLGPVEEALQ